MDDVSDLVRGHEAQFLSQLEDRIEVFDPANTELVIDESSRYDASLLYLESQRRRTVPNDARTHLGHRVVMNLMPYQLDPALQALRQPRARILIAAAIETARQARADEDTWPRLHYLCPQHPILEWLGDPADRP